VITTGVIMCACVLFTCYVLQGIKEKIARVALLHTLFDDKSNSDTGSATELIAPDDSVSATATAGNATKNADDVKSTTMTRLVLTFTTVCNRRILLDVPL
jgi:hypothetical protein